VASELPLGWVGSHPLLSVICLDPERSRGGTSEDGQASFPYYKALRAAGLGLVGHICHVLGCVGFFPYGWVALIPYLFTLVWSGLLITSGLGGLDYYNVLLRASSVTWVLFIRVGRQAWTGIIKGGFDPFVFY
jgi:hypothetical protein